MTADEEYKKSLKRYEITDENMVKNILDVGIENIYLYVKPLVQFNLASLKPEDRQIYQNDDIKYYLFVKDRVNFVLDRILAINSKNWARTLIVTELKKIVNSMISEWVSLKQCCHCDEELDEEEFDY